MSPRLLLTFNLIPPQQKIAEFLKVKTAGRRIMMMDELLKTRLSRRICVWCGNRLVGKQMRYCSVDCRSSAWVNCYPQKPRTKAFLLIHEQACACKLCGVTVEDEISRWIKQRYDAKGFLPTLYQLGYALTHKFPVKFETDHTTPISHGGQGAGIVNIQILCVDCHKIKTKADYKKIPQN